MTHDEDFEPELLRMRDSGSPKGRKYLHRAVAEAARAGSSRSRSERPFSGGRIGRGMSAALLLASRGVPGRRAMVKASYVRLSGRGDAGARAHLRYIEREGTSREGAREGLYSAREDEADGKAFLERSGGDRHQFRFIVSAEDGFEYGDLKPLIRRVMEKVEEDLGTRLDWVAADHHDTAHPHSHILVRGRDDEGRNLVIARDYLSRGIRARVAEQLSLDLGPPSDRNIGERHLREVGADLFDACEQLSAEFGLPARSAGYGEGLSGLLARRLDLASGRFALLQGAGELVLVPWQPGMEQHLGRSISGRMGPGGFSWSRGKSLGIG
ncbi:MAG: DUF3363 domain-containing protein [Sphingomicrobium sp.]